MRHGSIHIYIYICKRENSWVVVVCPGGVQDGVSRVVIRKSNAVHERASCRLFPNLAGDPGETQPSTQCWWVESQTFSTLLVGAKNPHFWHLAGTLDKVPSN